MDTLTLPQAGTVGELAPWLASANVTIHCPRCRRAFRLQPHDRLEADGTLLCASCERADMAWHAEMNGLETDRDEDIPERLLAAAQ